MRADIRQRLALSDGLSQVIINHSNLKNTGSFKETRPLAIIASMGFSVLVVLHLTGAVQDFCLIRLDIKLPEQLFVRRISLLALLAERL